MASKAEHQRRWRQKNLERRREYQRKHRAENPDAMKARAAINNRIYRGQLTRPTQCERCGQVAKVDAHHPDYNQPLWVWWLCRPCHAAEDRERRSLVTEECGV